ncbi:response regulator [Paenibacillus oryzisoli]|uniref:response regulator n=1 Tax=Paenibacillus oryzisoli TaxID=1850517 RepID=UPI003D2D3FBB
MYRVLLVDDEAFVRAGLRDCVNWTELGLELAAEAEDGEIALSLMATMPVHIVLTDVKMPHMDGLDLAQAVRSQYPDVKVVFISGFGDVEFLKSALKLDAVDYILKPIKLAEIHEVLSRVVNLLEDEEKNKETWLDLQMKLNQSIPLLRERFLTSLVLDGVASMEALQEKFQLLNIRIPVTVRKLGVFVIRIDDYLSSVGHVPEREKQLISFALLNITEDVIGQSYLGHTFEIRPGEFAGLVHLESDEEEEQLYALIEACRTHINRVLKLNITIGVGSTVQDWMSLPGSYRFAAEAAEHRWYLGKNQIITMDSLESLQRPNERNQQVDVRACMAVLKSPDWQAVTSFVEKALVDPIGGIHVQQGRIIGMYMMIACSELALELALPTDALQASEARLLNALPRYETVAELRQDVLGHARLLYDMLADKREHKTRNVVTLIKTYIHDHYANELTIAEIAAHVFLTTTYICLLFKQETGMTINDYVIETRMKEAVRLLADPRYKTYDVCYAVGYKDPSYFSKLFKKQTGFTPSEYRERPL